MLAEWLAPATVDDFRRHHLQTAPTARPGAATAAVPSFSWQTLDGVLARAPDLLVVAGGRMVDQPAPIDLAGARALMARGLGFVVRRAEQSDEGLARLAAAFARDLPGETHVQLFVTAAGTNGFGWHWDFEDVFIVQTAGVKDYYFRDNTVDRHTRRGQQPDFTAFRGETSPMHTARLHPGDWLYLPARWWHVAMCVEDSLSISLGVFPDRK